MERAELKEGVRIATNATKGVFGTPTQKTWGNGRKQGKRLSKGFSTPRQPAKKSQSRPKGGKGGGGKGRGKGGKGNDGGRGRGDGATNNDPPSG